MVTASHSPHQILPQGMAWLVVDIGGRQVNIRRDSGR